MDRVYQSGASGVIPTPPAAPSSGYPRKGNAALGESATKPGPWWYYMITEEQRAVIVAAGLVPDHTNVGQLAQAILILAGQPAGINVYASFTAPPSGVRLLKRNGQAVARATYPALDAAIYCGNANNGTAEWGYRCNDPDNPSTSRNVNGTHIVLPNARGRFGRVLSDGASIDSGRSLWAYQAQDLQAHAHVYSRAALGTSDSIDGGGMTAGVSDDWTSSTGGTETRPYNYAETAWITY